MSSCPAMMITGLRGTSRRRRREIGRLDGDGIGDWVEYDDKRNQMSPELTKKN